jgi:hypothetical protein
MAATGAETVVTGVCPNTGRLAHANAAIVMMPKLVKAIRLERVIMFLLVALTTRNKESSHS